MSEGAVLSGQLNDFLGDDAAPEGTAGGDLSVGEFGYIGNKFFVNLFDFELESFFVDFVFLEFCDPSDQFCRVCFVEGSWKALIFFVEVVETVEDDVQLFGIAELFPVRNRHLFRVGRIRIIQTPFKTMKFHKKGDFNFSRNTSTHIGRKAPRVTDGKAMGGFDFNFVLFFVNLSHSLHFPKAYRVSVVESVLFFIVQVNNPDLFL